MKARISSIMDRSQKRAGLTLVCVALAVTLGPGSAFAVTEPVKIEPAPPATSLETLKGLLELNMWYEEDSIAVYHDPLDGQIDREQAISIAKASFARYIRQLVVTGADYGHLEANAVYANLTQVRSPGQEALPLDPRYSFWDVLLDVPGEEIEGFVQIHAQTGIICTVHVDNLQVEPQTEISPERLFSYYTEELGFSNIPYSGEGRTVAELTEIQLIEDVADGAAQVGVAVSKSLDVRERILDGGGTFAIPRPDHIMFDVALLPPNTAPQ
jgi:hypothetical protein